MSLNMLAGWASAIIGTAAFLPGIIGLIRKEWRPNQVSWSIWAIINAIAAITSLLKGAGYAVLVIAAFALGDIIIAILAFRYGKGWKWGKVDKISAILAGISIILWVFCKSPSLGLIFCLIAGECGTIPQAKDLWRQEILPRPTEKLAWALFAASSWVNLLAVSSWALVDWGKWLMPMSMVVGNLALSSMVLITARPGNHRQNLKSPS